MKGEEWWVMRIVVDRTEVAAGNVPRNIVREVHRGNLALVNGEVVEPVEVFDEQEEAVVRAQQEHARTGCAHKVVLNLEVP